MDIREEIKEAGIKEGIRKGLREGMEKGMEKGMQEGREEGMQKGREEGMQKGREEGMQQVALNMLQSKFKFSIISEMTGLSEKEIKTLKNGS